MFIKEVNNIRNKNKSIASTVKKNQAKDTFFITFILKSTFINIVIYLFENQTKITQKHINNDFTQTFTTIYAKS